MRYISLVSALIIGLVFTGVSLAGDPSAIYKSKCALCHGAAGGWSADNYKAVMTGGNNSPVVVPGDPTGSLLAQKLRGTQSLGGIMPPSGLLPEDLIQIILNWIAAGAPDN